MIYRNVPCVKIFDHSHCKMNLRLNRPLRNVVMVMAKYNLMQFVLFFYLVTKTSDSLFQPCNYWGLEFWLNKQIFRFCNENLWDIKRIFNSFVYFVSFHNIWNCKYSTCLGKLAINSMEDGEWCGWEWGWCMGMVSLNGDDAEINFESIYS